MRVPRIQSLLFLLGVGLGCEPKQRDVAAESSGGLVITGITTTEIAPTSALVTTETAITGGIATTVSSSSSATTSEPDALQRLEFERLPSVPTPKCEYGANGKWATQSPDS